MNAMKSDHMNCNKQDPNRVVHPNGSPGLIIGKEILSHFEELGFDKSNPEELHNQQHTNLTVEWKMLK
jgi:hypothetical protein